MKLTTEARNHLRSTEFAIPKTRSYPIHDAAHAHNALSRVVQFGSGQEKARVRAAVHRKFPSIGAQHKSIGHRIVAMGRKYA